MSRWLVTQNNAQFAVDDLDALKALAQKGKLGSGDMVQPPGATDWLYVSEIPELKGIVAEEKDGGDYTDEYVRKKRGLGTIFLIGALLMVTLVGASAMAVFYMRLPTGGEALIGGNGGLSYSEMLVTEPRAPLYAQPGGQGGTSDTLAKDSKVKLLAKRGDYYRVRTGDGVEGWVKYDHVLPMYLLGGGEVRDEYDPLYNPDRYVVVKNATWLQLDRNQEQLTVFRFQLANESRYPMTDLVLLATIKDSKGNELEKVEIAVEGIIPPYESTMVGTLGAKDGAPADEEEPPRSLTSFSFHEMAEKDPDLQLLYSDGVEVEMTTVDFTEASIDLLEIRAVPREG